MSGRLLRRAALALLLSGARAALGDPGDDEGSGDPEYARGRQAIEAKDWQGAVRLLSSAALRDTRNADIQNYLGYAYRNLKLGVVDYIIAGGADATITEGIMTGFCIMRIMSTSFNDSPESASRPFSRNRDGFVLGEGAWMFVMEREESARARRRARRRARAVDCDRDGARMDGRGRQAHADAARSSRARLHRAIVRPRRG